MSVRVRRVTTTRAGGVSARPFDTFNLGDHVGDDPAAVAANRKRLAAGIGLPEDAVVWMNQVHSANVAVVDGPRTGAVDETDALVSTGRRLALAVVSADCDVPASVSSVGAAEATPATGEEQSSADRPVTTPADTSGEGEQRKQKSADAKES